MSSDNNSARSNFASRLLSKAIQDRKTGDPRRSELTPAEAQKYAVQATETKEPVGSAQG